MNKGVVNTLGVIAGVIVVAVIIYLVVKDKEKDKRISELENNELKRLLDELSNSEKVTDEVHTHLTSLSSRYKNKHPEIAEELNQALTIYQSENKEKCIGSISICIENLLKARYKTDRNFRSWLKSEKNKHHKSATQEDFIEYAHKEKFLDTQEFQFASALRKVRNKAFHEAGFKLSQSFGTAYLLIGIEITCKLGDSLIG